MTRKLTGPISLLSVIAGTLVAYGAFSLAAALLSRTDVTTDFRTNDWTGGGGVAAVATASVLLGVPTSSNQITGVGIAAAALSLAAIVVGAVVGGMLGERWHTKLARRAADPSVGPARGADRADHDHVERARWIERDPVAHDEAERTATPVAAGDLRTQPRPRLPHRRAGAHPRRHVEADTLRTKIFAPLQTPAALRENGCAVDVQAEDVDEAMSVGDDLDRAAEVQGAVVWSPSGRCVSGVPLDDVLVQTLRVACAAADASTGGLAVVSPEWRVRTAMTLDEVAWEIETASYLAGVGPGPTSIRRREAVCVHDMSDVVDRYPVFARAALERAVFSSLSLPLVVRGATVGALTLYAESRNSFANAVTAAAAAEIASSVITWTGS